MANQSNSTFSIAPSIFNKEVVIVSCFFYVIIAFLAVFGNGLVIGSFIRYYRLRTITNYFVVSLAVADIIVGVISIPIWISILLYSSAEIGEVVNTVYNVLDLFAGTSSILHLVVISMERFFAVVYPIRHRNTSTKVYNVFLIAVWVIPAVACGSSIELKKTSREANMLFLFITFFVVPLFVILSAYARIWHTASTRIQPLQHSSRTMKRDMRIAFTIALVIGFFVIAWLPFFTVQLLLVFCHQCQPEIYSKGLLLFVKFMHYSNSAVNPIIYAIKIPEFRRAYKQLVELCLCCSKTNEDNSRTAGDLLSATEMHLPSYSIRERALSP
ncbi:octopamine receptor beta-1R-like [Acropora muricata]|uniref:octopamine receptor beta-1R-like n=1 Tax=Acropora muricata TaxID=159855 RepID=UPI0034E5BA35